jgi:HEAT repeat protein
MWMEMTPMLARGLLVALGVGLAGGLAGCTPDALSGGFDGPDPASRLHAARSAASGTDQRDLPELVELLDDDDPVVRWVAIGALRKRTGENFGYDHTAPRVEQQKAIERWKAYVAGLKSG